MTDPILVLEHARKSFGPVTVIDDVTIPSRLGACACCLVKMELASPLSSR